MNSNNGHNEKQKQVGRPSIKTEELLQTICKRVRKGETILKIANDPAMPCEDTIYVWLDSDARFSENLERAREKQADVWADQLLKLSDECPETHEAVGKRRLQIQSRQFLMSKFNGRYADKANEVNVTTQMIVMDSSRLKALQERSLHAETEVLRIEAPTPTSEN